MKRRLSVLVFILFVFCGSAFAAARCSCASYTVNLQAFASPFDQHQAMERLALDLGAQNVVAAVAPAKGPRPEAGEIILGELPRYLVLIRACDAYVCFIPKANVAAKKDYEWAVFDRAVDAFEEYSQHGEAAALGVITMGDGRIVVYWSSTGATAALVTPSER